MGMSINTNVASLNAQRNLSGSANSLATSMQRLSSGLRVNSAKDDAAGLAISERMNAQVRGLNVAARNANDGISLAQTAEGALSKVGDMLQRVRELAVQSANATNNASDRGALQAEVSELLLEIDRVAVTTKFNGTNLLNGSFSGVSFQVGANAGEKINVASITNAQLTNLGSLTTPDTYAATVAGIAPTAAGAVANGGLLINGINVGAIAAGANVVGQGANVAAAINAHTASTGVSAVANGTTGAVTLSNTTNNSGIVITGTHAIASTGLTNASTTSTTTLGTTTVGIQALTVGTAADATSAISAVDTALTQINTARANLGAIQSRFESAIGSIQVTAENLSAARGRIVDADFAAETANLSRAQILQQAGTAMVAQANALPQQVLQLLKG